MKRKTNKPQQQKRSKSKRDKCIFKTGAKETFTRRKMGACKFKKK